MDKTFVNTLVEKVLLKKLDKMTADDALPRAAFIRKLIREEWDRRNVKETLRNGDWDIRKAVAG